MQDFLIPILRSVNTEPIDRILNVFASIFNKCFALNGILVGIVDLIVSNPFLLISVSLTLIGFAVGIIKRIISF